MALDRSKFKATSVAQTIQKDNELNNQMGRDGGNRTDYLKFDQGTNIFRIYPPHPEEDGGGDMFAEPKVTVFLPMMVPQRDDKGQEMMDPVTRRPILKESVKSVFNSRIHAGTEKDLVEEYIAFSRQNLEDAIKMEQDSKKKAFLASKLEAITGNFMKKVQGLKYKQAWAMYVDKIVGSSSKFGMLEIGPAIKDRLNSLAASTDTGNDPLATDPFTDIETGRAIIVTYDKEAKRAQDYYKTELDNTMVSEVIAGRTYQLPRSFPLSDDQLIKFEAVTPLAKRFKNAFKRRDFELQMEGLEFFDTKNQIGTFEDPTWLSICEEISAYYPDSDNETTEEQHDVVDAVVTTAVTVEEPEEDKFGLMTRKELADFSKINKTGLIIKPTLSDDSIRESLREWELAQEDYVPEEQVEEDQIPEPEVEEQPTQQAPQTTTATTSPQDRLAAMRERLAKGSK